MKRLVERMVIQALPDTQYNAPARSQNTVHCREGGAAVSEEHQSKLAQYQVKVTLWEWKLLSLARTPLDRKTLPLGHCTSHTEHVWIEVEADDHSMRSNVWSNVPGDDTCPARHIQDVLARLRIRRLNQVSCPGGE